MHVAIRIKGHLDQSCKSFYFVGENWIIKWAVKWAKVDRK